MASTSANDLIQRALVKTRVIAPGESIPYGKNKQVLAELNDMLESWALEKLMVLADVLESFSLVVGTAEYTYGTGGTFNSARPVEIRDETFIRSGSTDYPCLFRTQDVYRRRRLKATSARPRIFTYNPEYPLMKVFFWPTPSATDTVHFRSSKTITSFATATTKVDLALGYRRAIISNLAIEVAPNFGKKVSKELAFLAEQSKKSIKAVNATPIKPMTTPDLSAMTGRRGYGDINSGPW